MANSLGNLHSAFSDKVKEMNGGKPISFGMKMLCSMASESIAVCIVMPFNIMLIQWQSNSMAPVAEWKNYI